MPIIHSAERSFVTRMVGGLNLGVAMGILTDVSLGATEDMAETIVTVQTAAAKRHVAERTLVLRIVASLRLINYYDATYIGGADADKATMLALSPLGASGALVF